MDGSDVTDPHSSRRLHNADMTVDLAWRDAVRASCEPVFQAADVGFQWNDMVFDRDQPAMLWEADPARFALRYPDSGIELSYGDQWPPPCIDYWIYVEPTTMAAQVCRSRGGTRSARSSNSQATQGWTENVWPPRSQPYFVFRLRTVTRPEK